MSQGNKPITLMDVLTSSGKYLEREKDPSCDGYVFINAMDLSDYVSDLLLHLGITRAKVSSGFRTASSNATAKGAEKSAHMTGEAVDLEDADGKLCAAIMADTSVLEKFDLYMECPQHTPKWVHLTTRAPRSRKRVFIP